MSFKSNFRIEEPVTVETPDRHSDTVTTHPAFGQISITRQSGYGALYGSDFEHHNCISIEITGSELVRAHSNDRYSQREVKLKLALSEAQWATFVSSVSQGGGVPCTIQRDHTGALPGLPAPKPRTEQFSAELRKTMEGALESANELETMILGMGLSKKKQDELLSKVHAVTRKIDGSATFVAEQFDEHMENTIEAAKSEMLGYHNGMIQQAGMAAIAAQSAPIMLPEPE